ncbi:MAG: ATP-dependent DNA ligase [Chloroflexi bacterium]|nr:ATP-dependent DNA ligase [Chloroflexota bacterium]
MVVRREKGAPTGSGGSSELEKYAEKRDFQKTPEPAPGVAPRDDGGPLRFVVQKHAARRMHYDLRLEADGVLKSWAVPKGPSLDPAEKRLAVHVEDHPLDYAGFEGVIPKGEYGAGEVIVWDTGTYVPDEPRGAEFESRAQAEQAIREGEAAGKIAVRFFGQKLHGSWALVRMKGADSKDWLLIKHSDDFADPDQDILRNERSVLSGASVGDIRSGRTPDPEYQTVHPEALSGARASPFPSDLAPMLPSLTEKAFSHPDWIFEPKLDGIRAIALLQEDSVRLLTRAGNDATSRYPALEHDLAKLDREIVLDGEIVALDDSGRPSFERLQQRMHLARPADIRRADQTVPIVYFVFDVLYADGYDLRRVPLQQRRRLLESSVTSSERIRLVESFAEDGETAFEAFVGFGLEGIIAKRADSLYEPGRRTQAWLKVKATLSDDFVVVGWTPGVGARAPTFGALALATFDSEHNLRFVSTVGSGFDDRMLQELRQRLDALVTNEAPVGEAPASYGPIKWVRPELVVEVKFNQWTEDGRLRAPVFMRLRDDKVPAEAVGSVLSPAPVEVAPPPATAGVQLVMEQLDIRGENAVLEVDGHQIKCTHLDKVFWPAANGHPQVTKRDLLKYLAQVSPYMLTHLKDRPLTLVRCPDGMLGERFYQKHIELGLPKFVDTVRLYAEHTDKDGEYVMCNNLATLLWLGQVAALELHPQYARVSPEPDGYHLGTDFVGSEEAIEASLLNYPDFVVFDLDPYIYSGDEAKGEEPALNRIAYERTCEVAGWVKELLDSLKLTAFVKTSGKTGLHVFVPILRQLDYDAARSACETIGRFLLRSHSKEVTMDWTVNKRTGKIFFDHNQNVRGKTLSAAFSPRLAPEASVSVPLRWEELGKVYPTDFTVHTAPARMIEHGDPWAAILDAKNDIHGLLGS